MLPMKKSQRIRGSMTDADIVYDGTGKGRHSLFHDIDRIYRNKEEHFNRGRQPAVGSPGKTKRPNCSSLISATSSSSFSKRLVRGFNIWEVEAMVYSVMINNKKIRAIFK